MASDLTDELELDYDDENITVTRHIETIEDESTDLGGTGRMVINLQLDGDSTAVLSAKTGEVSYQNVIPESPCSGKLLFEGEEEDSEEVDRKRKREEQAEKPKRRKKSKSDKDTDKKRPKGTMLLAGNMTNFPSIYL